MRLIFPHTFYQKLFTSEHYVLIACKTMSETAPWQQRNSQAAWPTCQNDQWRNRRLSPFGFLRRWPSYFSLDSVDNPNKSWVCALILPLGIGPLSLDEPNYLLCQQRKRFIRTSQSQPTPLPGNDLPDNLLPLRPLLLSHLSHTCSLLGSCLQVSYFDFKDF